MKSKLLFKSLLVVTVLLLSFSVWAQDISQVTIHVKTAGALSNLIPANRKDSIIALTLTGNLNGTDIRFIREMAGRDVEGNATGGKLAVLNFANANIVQGGEAYFTDYANYYTADNTISEWMFYRCSGLISITISENVTNIESEAFYGCSGLTGITIPPRVKNIGIYAFYDCRGITSITIPENVTNIESGAFDGCVSLASITIPNPATNIECGAFSNTAWFNDQPNGLVYLDKTLYTYKERMPESTQIQVKEGTLGIAASAFRLRQNLIDITIPGSVTNIGNGAFYHTGLRSATIPASVTDIGSGAFSECYYLTSIAMGNRVTSIGEYAFRNCYNLTGIAIPSSVTNIGNGAFYGCSGLTSVTIPSGVTNIGSHAFYACGNLTGITIPEGVKSLEPGLFWGCSELKSVTIPASVTAIGNSAFYDCFNLKSITIPSGVKSIENSAFPLDMEEITVSEQNTAYSSINGVLYNKDKTTLIYYPRSKKALSYTVPNSVTNIDDEAFYYNSGLKEIHSCHPVPKANSATFAYIDQTRCKLYVPKGSLEAYRAAPGWKDFKNIIEEGGVTAIHSIDKEKIAIRPASGGILIETKTPVSVAIYSASGQKVLETRVNGNEKINLLSGFYIVRINNESEKIIVK
jgi:hypothetical protein